MRIHFSGNTYSWISQTKTDIFYRLIITLELLTHNSQPWGTLRQHCSPRALTGAYSTSVWDNTSQFIYNAKFKYADMNINSADTILSCLVLWAIACGVHDYILTLQNCLGASEHPSIYCSRISADEITSRSADRTFVNISAGRASWYLLEAVCAVYLMWWVCTLWLNSASQPSLQSSQDYAAGFAHVSVRLARI